MRRTYKSKKDTGGVIDRRDLLQNLDEKSSAYNAFFIQNIKQTKRELSCIGSSNAHGIASNRVRKKKYVKRIVKEVETPSRVSLSHSAYLTPDKSIRVNKPMDPFDMLLNSSPACQVHIQDPKTESVTSKVDVFDKLLPKKEGRTYVRRKPSKPKKVNYSSSESSDSDKENSDEHTNVTRNTSDIKAYKLLIENDNNKTPKRINDSINNIVNNLSLINRLKHKHSFNDSLKRPYKNHRLTRNIQSPILNSPLCSTPFKVKYRGESIYNFSPISDNKDDNSPKHATITEGKDNSNNSIIFLNNDKTKSPRKTIENVPDIENPNDSVVSMDNNEIAPENNTIIEEDNKDITVEEVNYVECNDKTIPSVEISSFQTTEAEPFFGFSNNDVKEILENEEIETPNDITMPNNNTYDLEVSDCESNDENNVSCVNVKDDDDSLLLEHNSGDKDSLYDTCTSEQSSGDEQEIVKEPVVKIKRMNDSSFLRYYVKNNKYSSESDDNVNNDDSKQLNDGTEKSLGEEDIAENNDSVQDAELSQEEFNSFETKSEANESNSDKTVSDNKLSENEVSDSIESDIEASDEEKCISFVTTRRRNEVTNNSMMSIFNASYASSSTDCDKTVLSNNEINNTQVENVNDDIVNVIGDDNNVSLSKEVEPPEIGPTIEDKPDTKVSFVTTRNSNITDRRSCRQSRQSTILPTTNSVTSRKSSKLPSDSIMHSPDSSRKTCFDKPAIVLQPGKKWERSLSIYRRITMMTDHFDQSILEDEPIEKKGRKYRQSVICTMEMQDLNGSLHNESINNRRSTFVSKPSRSTIRIVKVSVVMVINSENSRIELNYLFCFPGF
ncbi:unnamed protein product [Chrysodeixis includens]|uniref:Uncharacterized protein n=1 Tax=Chrysodeixis includens TaxID=689277 RepID=A0A9N8KXW0_CHRIL|nr:unnamed protein product [Chrysodeixis includens]